MRPSIHLTLVVTGTLRIAFWFEVLAHQIADVGEFYCAVLVVVQIREQLQNCVAVKIKFQVLYRKSKVGETDCTSFFDVHGSERRCDLFKFVYDFLGEQVQIFSQFLELLPR